MLEKLRNFMKLCNDFLFLVVICTALAMIIVKLKSFQVNQVLKGYEDSTIKLKDEEEDLTVVLAFLTSPERLNKLFDELKDKYFIKENVIVKQQIKDLQGLDYYFASRIKNYNLNESVAQK